MSNFLEQHRRKNRCCPRLCSHIALVVVCRCRSIAGVQVEHPFSALTPFATHIPGDLPGHPSGFSSIVRFENLKPPSSPLATASSAPVSLSASAPRQSEEHTVSTTPQQTPANVSAENAPALSLSDVMRLPASKLVMDEPAGKPVIERAKTGSDPIAIRSVANKSGGMGTGDRASLITSESTRLARNELAPTFRRDAWSIFRSIWYSVVSLTFLAPAEYARRNHMHWFSFIFAAGTVTCLASHFCNTHAPQVLLGCSHGCNGSVAGSMRFMNHGMLYYLCFQLSLATLGPEDPGLQNIQANAEAHIGPQAAAREFWQPTLDQSEKVGLPWFQVAVPGVPEDVIRYSRFLPGLAILFLLNMYPPSGSFNLGCIIWYGTMLVCSLAMFWINRVDHAAGVLLRFAFWRRVFECLLVPTALCGLASLIFYEFGAIVILRAVWPLVLSGIALFVLWRVLKGESVSFGYDDPGNPIIAHHMALAPPLLISATAVAALIVDAFAHPSLGHIFSADFVVSATSKPPGETVCILGSIFVAAATAVHWIVVDMASAYGETIENQQTHSSRIGPIDKWVRPYVSIRGSSLARGPRAFTKPFSKPPWLSFRFAVSVLGYLAASSAFIGALLAFEDHVFFVWVFFLCNTLAIVCQTFSLSTYRGTSWSNQHTVACALVIVLIAFFGSFRDKIFIDAKVQIFQKPLNFGLGAALVALTLVWPLPGQDESKEALAALVRRYRVCG